MYEHTRCNDENVRHAPVEGKSDVTGQGQLLSPSSVIKRYCSMKTPISVNSFTEYGSSRNLSLNVSLLFSILCSRHSLSLKIKISLVACDNDILFDL